MKKRILINLILLLLLSFAANANSIKDLRAQFYNASYEKISVDEYDEILEKYESTNEPIVKGYRAMYYMLVSRKSWNPYSKYANFSKGKELLEEAIEEEPSNLELIYLRYCIQVEIPKILNYSNNIKGDKTFILKNWFSLKDEDLKLKVKNYFLENKFCSADVFNDTNA